MQYGRSFFITECGIKVLKKSSLSIPTRIGIVVPKKLAKTIVKRNRIKRQVRHIFIKLLPRLQQGYDMVFLTREGFLKLEFEKMREKVIMTLEKVGVLIQTQNAKVKTQNHNLKLKIS